MSKFNCLEVIETGVNFLRKTQKESGFWIDFDTLAGLSDEWVTAYVGCHLCGISDESRALAKKAQIALERRFRVSGGWGFNRYVPADADSSIWGLRLFELLGESSFRSKRAEKFILKHRKNDGGLSTYHDRSGIIRYIGAINVEGWTQEHVCVTAAASYLKMFRNNQSIRSWLVSKQSQQGNWNGYWWHDDEYTTNQCIMLISHPQNEIEYYVIKQSRMWCTKKADSVLIDRNQLNAFNISNLIMSLLAIDKNGCHYLVEKLSEKLIAMQRQDGSWLPSARLRIPPPNLKDPNSIKSWSVTGKGGGCIITDINRTFSTATALAALSQFSKL